MDGWMRLAAGTVVLGLVPWLHACRLGPPPPVPDLGGTHIASSAEIQADEKTVGEILTSFSRADDALRRQDLHALMDLYSESYRYHSLNKERLRNIWQELFQEHHAFSTTHIFTKIKVESGKPRPTAEITCTGSIWAISHRSGQRVNIDSWYAEAHYLIDEEGVWRIRGHAWERSEGPRFVISSHPFF